ncbi:iron ABC transporter permease [Ruminiclostridium herbifermentans]|uniref:Iron ABC transporter permease n=1 Tax=Ruminiclostridium herbifermentans TaxID=2488810 RepID=A0A4U7JFX5_9FIRM|nr:iron ABC transporter permease [Ruminiclostridium herbifermentans]QNU67949.1 iron ABC transporter permease [Ruminiclostridium herbifermentans]
MKSGKKPLSIWLLITFAILGLFIIFVVFPIVLILYKSIIMEDGSISFAYFAKFFSKKFYWSTLINSFKVTIASTLVSAVLGLIMAYVLRSVKIKGSKYLNILIVISYLSPPFIGAYAWVQLLGRNGFITRILNSIFHVQLGGIYGFAGIVLVFSLQSFPLVYMYVSGALKNLDNSLNEAAESLGCTVFQRVWRIIVPLVTPTLLASSLLVFMRVFSDFGTPMLIGEGYKTFPVLLYSQFMGEVNTDAHFAAALCVIVIAITLIMFFLQKFIGNRLTYSMSALKPMEAENATGVRNILAHFFVYAVVLVAILPQLTVMVTSFLETRGASYTGQFTLQNYKNILMPKNAITIINTYKFGLIAILLVVVIGVLVSYLTVRKPSFLTSILDTLTMFPYIIPGSVLGISFLYAFNKNPLLLSGTATIIIISLCIRRMPYTIRSSTAIIGQISPSIEEAAVSLGTTEMKSFIKITVPMMMAGVLSGAIMSWITLISELSSSIILYTSRTQTLTVAIYAEVIRSNFGNAAAYSTILTITSIVSLLIFFKVSGNNDISV